MPPKILGGFINPAGALTNKLGNNGPLTTILDPAKFASQKLNMPMLDFAGNISGTTKPPNPYAGTAAAYRRSNALYNLQQGTILTGSM